MVFEVLPLEGPVCRWSLSHGHGSLGESLPGVVAGEQRRLLAGQAPQVRWAAQLGKWDDQLRRSAFAALRHLDAGSYVHGDLVYHGWRRRRSPETRPELGGFGSS